ncbi:transcription elongation factor Elf1 like-domain-containing protein [Ochromonadaceae sp. CCMP2298]|nr:transcription elongation factor Elf1 like-domain-containing protein [Ochromonadaceae sp. CCMP2298]|mmetsp:Transcript_28676/g.63661  ORF Transcript_28676/g.63661 Transcript_28676/m.63661 type:complete len:114 (+) Transcript_28676:98-439(+)
MGKRRRAAKKVVKKVKQVVAKVFKCPFCNHEKAVQCKLDRRSDTAALDCTVCGVAWETSINKLSEPIDVYTDWLDEIHAVNEENATNIQRQTEKRQAERETVNEGYADEGAEE